ncbi:MAG: mechanosensitive ion channel [Flavobacteriales bacterium]|nr:mechanosensitive ion channel [Flavobacteriales bacterium]
MILEVNIDKLGLLATTAIDVIVDFGPRLILALLTLFIGLRVIKLLIKFIRKAFDKGHLDITLRPFLTGVTNWTLKILLFVSVASMLGIETTSFVAVLGAASLAVGLALQGTLANLAGGVLCLLFKPYQVGDFISAQGESGRVREIQIFTTVLISLENKTIIIPNGTMMNGNITNYSREGKIRVDITIGIAYDSNIKRAKEILLAAMLNNEKILSDPAPFVGVHELADSSINLAIRPYCLPGDYWDVYFAVQETSKLALDEAKITIPFPQRDVHIYKEVNS